MFYLLENTFCTFLSFFFFSFYCFQSMRVPRLHFGTWTRVKQRRTLSQLDWARSDSRPVLSLIPVVPITVKSACLTAVLVSLLSPLTAYYCSPGLQRSWMLISILIGALLFLVLADAHGILFLFRFTEFWVAQTPGGTMAACRRLDTDSYGSSDSNFAPYTLSESDDCSPSEDDSSSFDYEPHSASPNSDLNTATTSQKQTWLLNFCTSKWSRDQNAVTKINKIMSCNENTKKFYSACGDFIYPNIQ